MIRYVYMKLCRILLSSHNGQKLVIFMFDNAYVLVIMACHIICFLFFLVNEISEIIKFNVEIGRKEVHRSDADRKRTPRSCKVHILPVLVLIPVRTPGHSHVGPVTGFCRNANIHIATQRI